MTEQTDRTQPLIAGGTIALVLGAIVAFFGQQAGDSAAFSAELMRTTPGPLTYVWLWLGIVLLIAGLAALICGIALRARRR